MFRTALTMAAIVLIAAESPAEERPVGASSTSNYPPSATIKNLIIHPERTSIGNGDNWPITWAGDGHHYTVYCDGEGFGGGSGKGSMSLARIIGEPPDFSGENLTSPTGHKEGGGPEGRKASGLLMVEGVLYMWVRNLKSDGTGASLSWSDDRGNHGPGPIGAFPRSAIPRGSMQGRTTLTLKINTSTSARRTPQVPTRQPTTCFSHKYRCPTSVTKPPTGSLPE